MRFWQKIFIISLLVLTVSINAIAVLLIGNNHRLNQNKEVDSGKDEYSIIVSSFQTNLLYERYRQSGEQFGDEQIAQAARDFSYQYSLDNLFMQINKGEERIYSNFSHEVPAALLTGQGSAYAEERPAKLMIRHQNQKVYLYISAPVVFQSEDYIFTTIKDISTVYNVRDQQMRFFVVMAPIASFVIAMLMLLVSRLLTGRINRLRRMTERVAQGEYNAIPIKSKDEIGELTADFNQMTEAVKQKVEQLERTAQDRKNFIDNMTHEMKTPLTSIIGFSDLLRSARLDDETIHDYAESIYKEGKYLKTISSKLMDIILLRQEPQMRPVDVERLFSEISQAVEPIADNKGVRFSASPVKYTVTADKELLKSLLYNLLDNAMKATPVGKRVRLKAYLDEQRRLVLEVRDEGGGIPKGELLKIFEPFYRVDKARSREAGGAGLGLALCAQIAEVHRAKLNIESEIGKGTCVSIRFPEEAPS